MKTIRELRKARNLTLQQLADELEISYATMQRIESGSYEIKKVNLLAIAQYFGVNVTDIKEYGYENTR